MSSKELRSSFLMFFEKRGHKIVPSSSLLPTDPSVLFTTAGMQQFKPYFLGEKSPYGNRTASCQKCFRTSDIEEVGDSSHLTFLEMLGNFSFGDYFKKEAIQFAYDFLFKELKLPIEKATFTIFAGDEEVPEDTESRNIWLKLGISENKITGRARQDNFWGPTGLEGPCGPTTEIYIYGIEVWNLVFNEYYQDTEKKLTPSKQKGVDTGMGLERLAMAMQGKSNVFETDLFSPITENMLGDDQKSKRIIADHIKGAVFLISEGILPSNVERGYVLRRLLRRAIRYGKLLGLSEQFLVLLAQRAMDIYDGVYPELKSRQSDILTVIRNEQEKFERTLENGLREIKKIDNLTGETAFRIYETYGFPLELIEEIRQVRDREAFFSMQKKHQEVSRAGAQSKFGGGGEFSPKLHTATHLLHSALRQVLGNHVQQMGSDINPQRLRFDFSHPQKLTEDELAKVQDLVNGKIKDDLEVRREEMSYAAAIKSGALAFFKEKYPETVSVYSISGPSTGSGQAFSREICAGPHIKRTGELGRFKIIKEESSGAGIRRIRAILE